MYVCMYVRMYVCMYACIINIMYYILLWQDFELLFCFT